MRRLLLAVVVCTCAFASIGQAPAEASICAGVVTVWPGYTPMVRQLSSLSVNTPTYQVGVTIPNGWAEAPFANPQMAPTLVYSYTTTYYGPTYFGWVNNGYLTGDVHYFGGFGANALIMVVPDYIGYVSTTYSGTCPTF